MAKGTAESAIGMFDGIDAVDLFGGETHALEFRFKMCATIYALIEINVEDGVNAVHYNVDSFEYTL
jgi:hypothetical protein